MEWEIENLHDEIDKNRLVIKEDEKLTKPQNPKTPNIILSVEQRGNNKKI